MGNDIIPRGVRLGVPMHEIHHDPDFYCNPGIFNAFRFCSSQPRGQGEKRTAGKAQTAPDGATANTKVAANSNHYEANLKMQRSNQPGVVAVGDTFLGFGYGKHSCPGRFFAAHEMKLLLAHLVRFYDVEYMPERPAQQTIMETKITSSSAIIKVRRRTKFMS